MLGFWILFTLAAFGWEKYRRYAYQVDYDNNPYTGMFKSEKWLAERGLTATQACLQSEMRRICRFDVINGTNKWTPERVSERLYSIMNSTFKFESRSDALKQVEENWYCLQEIKDKPEYIYKLRAH